MKKYRCPWCGVSLENQKISNIPKKKIPSMFIYGKCETCNNYYGQNHLSSRVILCAVLMLCTIPAMIFLYKFLILIFLVLFGLSLFIIRTPLVKMEYEEKLSTNENEPLDYTKVFEIAQKDFREVLETCEREIDNEFIVCLGKDYDINLFSLEICKVINNNPNKIIEYVYAAKYKGEPKYIYVLKLFEDYRIFDNVFYPIKINLNSEIVIYATRNNPENDFAWLIDKSKIKNYLKPHYYWNEERFYLTDDEEYGLLFYNICELRMCGYYCSLAIYENNNFKKPLFYTGDEKRLLHFNFAKCYNYHPRINCLSVRLSLYKENKDLTHPYLFVDIPNKKFALLPWDFTSIYYGFKEAEKYSLVLYEEFPNELEHRNIPRKTGFELDLLKLKWHDVSLINNIYEVYWQDIKGDIKE